MSRSNWVLLGFLAIAGFFLLTEHRAHVLGIFPYLLLLACPLMHLFHGGHGGHEKHSDDAAPGHSHHSTGEDK
jgi:hypothetical protein